jgi:hypothetical protein
MTNDMKIRELSKKLDVELVYSDEMKLHKKKVNEETEVPNLSKLKKLTKSFRNNLEDYTLETTSLRALDGRY